MSTKSGIHRHHKHKIKIVENIVDEVGWSTRIDRHTGLRAKLFDSADRPMQIRTHFLMHRDNVCSRRSKALEITIRILNHEVSIENEIGMTADRADQRGPKRDIRNKMTVHHVEMEPFCSSRFNLLKTVA